MIFVNHVRLTKKLIYETIFEFTEMPVKSDLLILMDEIERKEKQYVSD